MEKCLYGGNARKASEIDYHTSLHHQLAFYIVMFKKEKFIPQMCILFYNQLWGWDGRTGRVGRESLFAVGGNLKKKEKRKKKLYAHYKCSSVCISDNYDEPDSNSFITKLDSFILQRYAKFLKQCLNLIITCCICTKCGDILLQFIL